MFSIHTHTVGRRLLLAASLLAVLLIPAAGAAQGDLDSSFGAGGKVATALGPADAEAADLALQPDGKLVVGGFARSGAGNVFAAFRVAP